MKNAEIKIKIDDISKEDYIRLANLIWSNSAILISSDLKFEITTDPSVTAKELNKGYEDIADRNVWK